MVTWWGYNKSNADINFGEIYITSDCQSDKI